MYLPRHFAAPPGRVEEFLALPRLAEVVTHTSSGLAASTLPLLYEPASQAAGRFLGHFARANPQCAGQDGDEVLVIVRGADGYVSPASYPSHRETGEVVPTWNYLTVQGHGCLVIHDDASWTRAVVTRLTTAMEGDRTEPWSVEDAPGAFLDAQLRAIVGFEVLLDRLEGKWKLSQNRLPADRDGVVAQMAGGSARDKEVAVEMTRLEN